MAQDDSQHYPLVDPSGKDIPFEVFRPLGLMVQDIADTVSSAKTLPVTAELLIVYATDACIVRFDAIASIPATNTHQTGSFFISPETWMTLDPNGAETFTVIGIESGVDGSLFINTTKKWKDLQKPAITNRA